MIDVHCHLTYEGLDEIKESVVKEAKKVMNAIITCGYPEDAKKALEISERHKNFVYLTLGLHPIHVVKMSDKEIDEYKRFVIENKQKIVAVGEIGLDFHWIKEKSKNERVKEIFVEFLELAKEVRLPVILHLRKAEKEGFKIITGEDIKEAVFHCYAGNLTLAKQIVDEGYYISLGTNLMRSKNTKKIAKKFPLDKLLTETDAPFLSPFPGKVNVPQNVQFVLERMSELRNMSVEEIDGVIMKNARELFKI